MAFKYDAAAGTFVRLWYGRRCDLAGEPRHVDAGFDYTNNNGPSLYDLDDDGVPEVLYERFVYDANGCVLNPSQPYDNYLRLGTLATVADIDDDGVPELVHFDGIYEWSGSDWVIDSLWNPPAAGLTESVRPGLVAVADLGDFPGAEGDAPGRAEIVVASAPLPHRAVHRERIGSRDERRRGDRVRSLPAPRRARCRRRARWRTDDR